MKKPSKLLILLCIMGAFNTGYTEEQPVEVDAEVVTVTLQDVCQLDEDPFSQEIARYLRCLDKNKEINPVLANKEMEKAHNLFIEVSIDEIKNEDGVSNAQKIINLISWLKEYKLDINSEKEYFSKIVDTWTDEVINLFIENDYFDEESFFQFYQLSSQNRWYGFEEYLVKKNSLLFKQNLLKRAELNPLIADYEMDKQVFDYLMLRTESHEFNNTIMSKMKDYILKDERALLSFKKNIQETIANSLNKENLIGTFTYTFQANESLELWSEYIFLKNKVTQDDLKNISGVDGVDRIKKLISYLNKQGQKADLIEDLLESIKHKKTLLNKTLSILINMTERNESLELSTLKYLAENATLIDKATQNEIIANLKPRFEGTFFYLNKVYKTLFKKEAYNAFIISKFEEQKEVRLIQDIIHTVNFEDLNKIFEIAEKNELDIWNLVMANQLSNTEAWSQLIQNLMTLNSFGKFEESFLELKIVPFFKIVFQKGDILMINKVINYLIDQSYVKTISLEELRQLSNILEERTQLNGITLAMIKLEDFIEESESLLYDIIDDINNGDFEITSRDVFMEDLISLERGILMVSHSEQIEELDSALINLENLIMNSALDELNLTSHLLKLIEIEKISLQRKNLSQINTKSILNLLESLYLKKVNSRSERIIKDSLQFAKLPNEVRRPIFDNINESAYRAMELKYALGTVHPEYLRNLDLENLSSLKYAIKKVYEDPILLGCKNCDPQYNMILRNNVVDLRVETSVLYNESIIGPIICELGSQCTFNFPYRKNVGPLTLLGANPDQYNKKIDYNPYKTVDDKSTSYIVAYNKRDIDLKLDLNDVLIVDASIGLRETPEAPKNGRNAIKEEYEPRTGRRDVCVNRWWGKIGFIKFSICWDWETEVYTYQVMTSPAYPAHPGRDGINGSDSANVNIETLSRYNSNPFGKILIFNSSGNASEGALGGRGIPGHSREDMRSHGANGFPGLAGSIGEVKLNNKAKTYPITVIGKRTLDPVRPDTEEETE